MEPTVEDVAEDLEAAADGFVSRVAVRLKRHFGSDAESAQKNSKGYRGLRIRP